MSHSMYRNVTKPFNCVCVFFFLKGTVFKRKQTIVERRPPPPPQKKQEIAQLTLYRTLVEASNLINDLKCNKGFKCNKVSP